MLETLLTELAKQGVPGIFCAILVAALYFVSKALLKAKDTAIEQQKAYTQALAQANEGTKALLIEMKDFSSSVLVEQTKTQADLKNALENQKTALHDLQTKVDEVSKLKPPVEQLLQQEQARLAAANQRGGR